MTVFMAKNDEPLSEVDGSTFRRPKLRYAFWRPALDACAAFSLCVLVSLGLSSDPTSASPHHLLSPGLSSNYVASPAVATPGERPIFNVATRTSASADDAVYRQTGIVAAWLLLSFAFSLLAALNLALVRHLRQAYANPRKRT